MRETFGDYLKKGFRGNATILEEEGDRYELGGKKRKSSRKYIQDDGHRDLGREKVWERKGPLCPFMKREEKENENCSVWNGASTSLIPYLIKYSKEGLV